MKIAILDDYQNVALKMADWSAISKRAELTVFNDHLSDADAVVRRLEPFDVVCVMRENTFAPRYNRASTESQAHRVHGGQKFRYRP